MKRPQKVTRETRLNQYARKMYGKEKIEKILDDDGPSSAENLSGKKGAKKKIRTAMNRDFRRNHKMDAIADGNAYRKETSWEE